MKQYTAGTAIRLSVAFTVVATAAPVDPTTVTGKVRKPDGSNVTLTVVKDSTGNYHADFTPSDLGMHTYELAGTGAAEAVYIGRFLVTQQPF